MNEKKTTTEKTQPARKGAAEAELEQRLSVDEILADMPELRAPEKLRIRHRSQLMSIFLRADEQGILTGGEQISDISKIEGMLTLLSEVDDFAESIAVDKEAYERWSIANGDNHEAFVAILTRYASAVGESIGSAS